MVTGIPTDIMLGMAVPPGNMDGGSSVNCFAVIHNPNEDDSVGNDNAPDVYDCRGVNLCTPPGGIGLFMGIKTSPMRYVLIGSHFWLVWVTQLPQAMLAIMSRSPC
jgi:hypothetical protein